MGKRARPGAKVTVQPAGHAWLTELRLSRREMEGSAGGFDEVSSGWWAVAG